MVAARRSAFIFLRFSSASRFPAFTALCSHSRLPCRLRTTDGRLPVHSTSVRPPPPSSATGMPLHTSAPEWLLSHGSPYPPRCQGGWHTAHGCSRHRATADRAHPAPNDTDARPPSFQPVIPLFLRMTAENSEHFLLICHVTPIHQFGQPVPVYSSGIQFKQRYRQVHAHRESMPQSFGTFRR